jgi:hypothetical protein
MRERLEGSLLRSTMLSHLGSAEPVDFLRCTRAELEEAERAILRLDPGHRAEGPLDASAPPEAWVAEILLPSTLRALGYVRWARHDFPAARIFFEAYLDSGHVADAAAIHHMLDRCAAGDRFVLEYVTSQVKGLLRLSQWLGLHKTPRA